ncbi:hypothetical protein AB0A69_16785 [Streptomyces sp. NPDC045431]|uniref:hypothetical protein n=1 Tax=Streptomyces sp. NPDC045431 TaxID=3155613 RepID=UPI0033D62EEB
MVEGEGCSRPTGDPGDDEAGPTRARGPVRGLPEPAADLPALLAALGRYLEGHAPDEVVVLLREELARREFQAYVNGWRDAADEYEPVLEEARRIAQTRRLRLVGRTPGQAAVIPFPQGEDPAADDESAGGRPETGPESPGPGAEASASASRRPRGRGGASGDAGRDPAPVSPPTSPASRSRATSEDAAAHPRDRPARQARQAPADPPAAEPPTQRQAPAAPRPHPRENGQGQVPPPSDAVEDAHRPPPDGNAPGTNEHPQGQDAAGSRAAEGPQRRPAAESATREGPQRQADAQDQAADQARTAAAAPKLVAKSRSSRVPTIPRLPARRRRPGDHP